MSFADFFFPLKASTVHGCRSLAHAQENRPQAPPACLSPFLFSPRTRSELNCRCADQAGAFPSFFFFLSLFNFFLSRTGAR